MEFLAEFDKEETLKKKHPTIYNNILIIGFSLLNRPKVALEKLKLILDVDLNTADIHSGKVFQFAFQCIQHSITSINDSELTREFEACVDKALKEKRIFSFDILSMPEI